MFPVGDNGRARLVDNAHRQTLFHQLAAGHLLRVRRIHVGQAVTSSWLKAAQNSPAYQFVKEWGLALPLRPEFRTMAMMYYIPPLSPVVSTIEQDLFKLDFSEEVRDFELFDHLEAMRLPIKYLANMFTAGDEAIISGILRKLLAVRTYMRRKTVDGVMDEKILALLAEAGTTVQEVEAIYRLTTLPSYDERFVIPEYHRETAVEAWQDPQVHKGSTGFGYVQLPRRGE